MINIYIRKRENKKKKKKTIIEHTKQKKQSFRVLINIFGLQPTMSVPPLKGGLVSTAYCPENHAIVVACDLINCWRGISPKPCINLS